jgi:hypothetical protein
LPFTIPNHGTALYDDQSEIDSLDFSIITDAIKGNAVFSGCQVSAQTSPDGSVLVSAGTYRIGGTNKTWAGGSVSVVSGSANTDGSTATAADANWHRYDLIVLSGSNTCGVVHGTTNPPTFPDIVSNPKYPSYSGVVIAAIIVAPTLTAITNGHIVKKDVNISVNAFYDQAHLMTGTSHTGEISNAQHGVRSVASAHAASHIIFTPANGIAATDVQSAIAELRDDPTTRIVFSKQGAVALATGAMRWYNDTGRTLTFTAVRASVSTAPTGATIIVDVNRDGTTIFTTQSARPAIAISGFTAKVTNPAVTTIADGSYLTVDIDQIGSTIAGSDLTVAVEMKG